MAKHHYVRVYATGANAFWYNCACCGGRGYTDDGYDETYADLFTVPTAYICESCVVDDNNEHNPKVKGSLAYYRNRIYKARTAKLRGKE